MPRHEAIGALAHASVAADLSEMPTSKIRPVVSKRRAPTSSVRRKRDAELVTIKALADACEAEATRAGILHVVA